MPVNAKINVYCSSEAVQVIDPSVCPVCGAVNQCAMEVAKATGRPVEPCWCVNVVFTPALLDRVPQAAKGIACVCAACVAKAASISPKL